MKNKNNNRNSAIESDFQVTPPIENTWLLRPLNNKDRIKKADNVDKLIARTRQMLFQMDDCC